MECGDGSGISSRIYDGGEDGAMGSLAARPSCSRRSGGRLAIRITPGVSNKRSAFNPILSVEQVYPALRII